jgi:phage FluMu protein Com
MSEIARLSAKMQEVKKETKIAPRQKTGFSRSTNSPVDRILFLQRTIGNQAIQRLIKSGTIQAKLRIGQPGDVYEQEADRVAEQVMSMPEPCAKERKNCIGQTTSIQRKCPKCKEDEEIKRKPEENPFQAQRNTGSTNEATPELEANINNLSGRGQPLPDSIRAFFEPRFGYDFSQVRVHSGAAAEQSARDVNARAYTVGQNVVFGANQFAPGSTEGRRLLAHELTHVIQQGGADSTIISHDDSETGDSTLQKYETIAADETVGDISRQAMSTLNSGMMLQRAACPCCADSISISNINRIDNATHMGHSFDTNMGLSYPASGPSGSCTLEWWEKTNVPYTPGMSPDTWTNMYQLLGGASFERWNNRREECATSSVVKDTDPPSLGKTPGRTVTRTLEFRVVINSMPPTSEGGCAAAFQQVTAKQILTMVNGAPDWAASSFTTP